MALRSLEAAIAAAEKAYEDGDWRAASRLRPILFDLAAEALVASATEAQRILERAGAKLFAIAVAKHDADALSEATSAAWLAMGIKEISTAALNRKRTPELLDVGAADRIRIELYKAPSQSNMELAKRASTTVETVSRTVRDLKQLEEVVTEKAGQRRLTFLTEKGRRVAEQVLRRRDVDVSAATDEVLTSNSGLNYISTTIQNAANHESGNASPLISDRSVAAYLERDIITGSFYRQNIEEIDSSEDFIKSTLSVKATNDQLISYVFPVASDQYWQIKLVAIRNTRASLERNRKIYNA